MEQKNDFTPMIIGKSDQENYQLISDLYEKLVTLMSPLKWEIETALNVQSMPLSDILDILNMDKSSLESYMKRSFIVANKISFPGLNVEKIIENDLLELPDGFANLLLAKKEIELVIEKILATSFQFPVSSLYIEEENIFTLTEEFKTELAKSTTAVTESQLQNEVLDAVQKFCDAVNLLIGLGVVRSQGDSWTMVGERLMFSIENTKGSTPLSPHRKMFRRSPLNRFLENKSFLHSDKRRNSVIG